MRALLLLSLLFAWPLEAATRVVLLHFSDYHSHAVPFYSEGKAGQGGIARAIGYLKQQKRRGALVFSGGDMINRGSPSWSDKYGCVEWPWLNGVVDAMALGNHDADYGLEAFEACRKRIAYPVLSANTEGFQPYVVLKSGGARIGVFAVAGKEFPALMKAGLTFGDPVAAARNAVSELRGAHKVDAVVMIGHQTTAEDEELARSVAGIDVIFGTHSHEKKELRRIPDTNTWLISPSQYLTYVSRVVLTFEGGRIDDVGGGLVRVDRSLPRDATTHARVERLRKDLANDPNYSALFEEIGSLKRGLSAHALGMTTVELMRSATDADLALSTTSSFRHELPPGPLTEEQLRAAMPYDNEVVVCTASEDRIRALLAIAGGGNAEMKAYVTAVRPAASGSYRVATTDYVARVAAGYKGLLSGCDGTGIRAREQVRRWLASGKRQ